MAVGQRDQLIALGHEERIGLQEQCARPLRDQIRKGHFDPARAARIQKE